MITPSTLAKIFQEASVELKVELLTIHQVKYIEFMEVVANRLNQAANANRKKPGPKKRTPKSAITYNFNLVWDEWLKRPNEQYTPAIAAFNRLIKTDEDYSTLLVAMNTYKNTQISRGTSPEYYKSFPKFIGEYRDWLTANAFVDQSATMDSESF